MAQQFTLGRLLQRGSLNYPASTQLVGCWAAEHMPDLPFKPKPLQQEGCLRYDKSSPWKGFCSVGSSVKLHPAPAGPVHLGSEALRDCLTPLHSTPS